MGSIRGAHFVQHGPGAGHDVWDSKRVSDLDEFALDTGTSRPWARVLRTNITAAALLLTTVAASAPVISQISPSTCESRSPRFPLARSYSKVVALTAAVRAAWAADLPSSARPRLV